MQSSHSLFLLLLISSMMATIQGLETRKLDDVTVPGDGSTNGEKCTPCNPSPPPPSPPPPAQPLCPPPPPPALPPPAPKKPPSGYNNCPPPPSFIYITGPPGNLYPVDNDFGGAPGRKLMGLPVLIGCGLVGLLLIGFGF
ncbi:hypothetical protein Tsubulata_013296 [Turnera subulata]|uniref:Uncharacterized protein n=1 Tax=Turnera subulata TaxID=218843 RepID=A0A9Q0G4F2_9ROSI|nr:hypothetical protein Tsubulata_013296 [Turnera subulata]